MATNMKHLLAPVAFSLLASCGQVTDSKPSQGTTPAATTPSTPAPVSQGPMVRGYAHQKEASLFRLGSGVTYLSKQNLSRSIGSEGVFVVHELNGMSMAVPNASAHVLTLPSMFDNAEAHNQHTLTYFQNAGIPKDQISGVETSYEGVGGGSLNEVHETNAPIMTAHYSILRRSIDGIPVPDSFAFARFANDGSIVTEGVHWPAVPQKAVDEAKLMATAMKDPQQASAMRAKLPAGQVQVSIRHTSFVESLKTSAYASYEVMVSDKTTAVHHRHFDLNGAEFKLTEQAAVAPASFLQKSVASAEPAEPAVFSP